MFLLILYNGMGIVFRNSDFIFIPYWSGLFIFNEPSTNYQNTSRKREKYREMIKIKTNPTSDISRSLIIVTIKT